MRSLRHAAIVAAMSSFLVAATLKAFPKGLPERRPTMPRAVSLMIAGVEYLLAVGLALHLTRQIACRLGSIFLIAATGYIVIGMIMRNTPDCGCFGGWFRVEPWIHVCINGVLLTALGVAQAAEHGRGATKAATS